MVRVYRFVGGQYLAGSGVVARGVDHRYAARFLHDQPGSEGVDPEEAGEDGDRPCRRGRIQHGYPWTGSEEIVVESCLLRLCRLVAELSVDGIGGTGTADDHRSALGYLDVQQDP